MQPPARLPATLADLDEWSVYADWLQLQGDPRGELIARDLALPEAPSREELAGFHEQARRFCRVGKTALIAWCLGHVRTLMLVGSRYTMRGMASPDGGTLAHTHQLLVTPLGRQVEELTLPFARFGERAHWRRVLANLPPTCRRVRLALSGEWTADDCAALLELLPATVDELVLIITRSRSGEVQVAPFVLDRFAVVDLVRVPLPPQARAALEAALARTSRVRIRLAGVHLPRALGWERVVVGGPHDAGLIALDREAYCAFTPLPLLDLQQRHGVIGVRAQIAGAIPEDHGVAFDATGLVTAPHYREGLHLVRRGARWTLRGNETFRIRHGGHSIPRGQIIELADGDALAIERLGADGAVEQRLECTFVARDLDAAWRRRFVAASG